jgi:AraC-like DNA-binding protein
MQFSDQESILPSAPEGDLDRFREKLNAAYYPALVDVVGERPRLHNARLNAVPLHRSTIGFVRFGHQALVDPGRIDSYHVNVAVAGAIGSVCGAQSVLVAPGTAAIFTPNGRTRLPFWSDDAAQLCIKLDRRMVEEELAVALGRPVDRPLEISMALDLASVAGKRWLQTLGLLVESAATGPTPPAVLDHLERALVGELLFASRNSFSEELAEPGAKLLPRTVRRVVDLIESSPERLFTAGDLAQHAGVGVRRLEQAFKEHVGSSPLAYQTLVRLRRAGEDLRDPHRDETVTAVMHRWGFSNHARFAALFRREFGVNPADARRKAQGPDR